MRARTGPGGEEADRLQLPRIGGVENRHAIAEHVADVHVAAVDHDLYAVGAAALIAVRQVSDSAPDAVWRNGRLRSLSPLSSGPGRQRQAPQRRQTQQAFHVFTAGHGVKLYGEARS